MEQNCRAVFTGCHGLEEGRVRLPHSTSITDDIHPEKTSEKHCGRDCCFSVHICGPMFLPGFRAWKMLNGVERTNVRRESPTLVRPSFSQAELRLTPRSGLRPQHARCGLPVLIRLKR